jgi:ArsR family transcriptional regulator, arsenate/arsenite/antimonite-responsive transcriptional repressor
MYALKDFLKVTRALSEPNRVKIIKLLQQRPMFVSELQHALGIAQPTVSKHVKVLEEAGLIDFHKQGTWVRYHLTDGAICPCAASLLGNLKHWFENDPQVALLYEALSAFRKLERPEEHV